MEKIRVHYVGGLMAEPDNKKVWGGAIMTNYMIKKAFENSTKYKLVMRSRDTFQTIQEVKEFLDAGDISWTDETSILQRYFLEGYDRPDLIGAVTRSPVKRYNEGTWDAVYTPEWFYSGYVIRFNENEEKHIIIKEEYKGTNWLKKVQFVRHAIDINLLKPTEYTQDRNIVLWAGNKNRPAKNYELFEKIMNKINSLKGLPGPFEFVTLSNYAIGDYFNILDKTALVVNTSIYESFCGQLAEAMAKGVPCLLRKKLTGKYMYTDRPIQINYEVNSYVNKILELVDDFKLRKKEGQIARKYAEKNFSPDIMRKDIESVLDKIWEKKCEMNK